LNFADARKKLQADKLRKTSEETMAKQVLTNGKIKNINSSKMKKSDIFIFKAGDLITANS
jgi:K+-transporting ATPase ATPase B chain